MPPVVGLVSSVRKQTSVPWEFDGPEWTAAKPRSNKPEQEWKKREKTIKWKERLSFSGASIDKLKNVCESKLEQPRCSVIFAFYHGEPEQLGKRCCGKRGILNAQCAATFCGSVDISVRRVAERERGPQRNYPPASKWVFTLQFSHFLMSDCLVHAHIYRGVLWHELLNIVCFCPSNIHTCTQRPTAATLQFKAMRSLWLSDLLKDVSSFSLRFLDDERFCWTVECLWIVSEMSRSVVDLHSPKICRIDIQCNTLKGREIMIEFVCHYGPYFNTASWIPQKVNFLNSQMNYVSTKLHHCCSDFNINQILKHRFSSASLCTARYPLLFSTAHSIIYFRYRFFLHPACVFMVIYTCLTLKIDKNYP